MTKRNCAIVVVFDMSRSVRLSREALGAPLKREPAGRLALASEGPPVAQPPPRS